MQNIILDNYNIGYKNIFIYFIFFISVIMGIYVIISKNPIVSVLFLIGLFLSISGYLILTGLNFIGLAYLLVYIGAVSILFLFILMFIVILFFPIIQFIHSTHFKLRDFIPCAVKVD